MEFSVPPQTNFGRKCPGWALGSPEHRCVSRTYIFLHNFALAELPAGAMSEKTCAVVYKFNDYETDSDYDMG